MDKSGILGGALRELVGIGKKTVRQAVEAPLDIGKGALEQVAGRVSEGVPPEVNQGTDQGKIQTTENISRLRMTDEEEKARNLAATRRNLAAIMAPKTPQQPRPAEKVEGEKQQELQAVQEREVKKPPPLAVQRGQGKVETFRGVSG